LANDVPKRERCSIPECFYAGSLATIQSSSAENACHRTGSKTIVSAGIGFGDYGDNHDRFALIENEAHQSSTALHLLLFVRIPVQMCAQSRSQPSKRFVLHQPW
jgi:hypothetical protein